MLIKFRVQSEKAKDRKGVRDPMEIGKCKMEIAKFKMGKAPEHRRTPRHFAIAQMRVAGLLTVRSIR